MDSDYSVFTVLPPYNTMEAQLIVGGKLVTNSTGDTVTYQAVGDPSGSINTTSVGKGNFYTFTPYLYGPLQPDTGLLGWSMPVPAIVPPATAAIRAPRLAVCAVPWAALSQPMARWRCSAGVATAT